MPGNILIVCASTHHMLLADSVLTKNNIDHALVPVPAKFGESCSTGLRVLDCHKDYVDALLQESCIKLVGIFPYNATDSNQLLERLSRMQQGVFDALQVAAKGELLTQIHIQQLVKAEISSRQKIQHFAYELVKSKWQDYLLVGCLSITKEMSIDQGYESGCLESVDRAASLLCEKGIKNIIVQVSEEFTGPVQQLLSVLQHLKNSYSFNIIPYLPQRFSLIYPQLVQLGINHINFQLPFKVVCDEEDVLQEILFLRENPGEFLGLGKLLPPWDVTEGITYQNFYRMAVARIALGKVDIPCFTGDIATSLKAGANIVIYPPDGGSVGWDDLEGILVSHLGVGAREIVERRQPADG